MKSKSKHELRGFWLRQNDDRDGDNSEVGDEGYLLVGAIVAIFLVMLALGVAAGSIAKQLQREKEVEAVNRGNQYVRAIRVFYRKNGNKYPSSVEQLENTNNQKYLRQKYIDPLTGKDDWRLIHLGENKTTVKGFFGEDLPGLATGLGAASGLVSGTGTSTTGGSGSSVISGGGTGGINPSNGAAVSTALGSSTAGASAFGTSGSSGASSTTGSSGSSSFGSSSIGAPTGGGGLIIGIGSSKLGESFVVVNEQTTYQTWEFLYDPRIEAMYAKATLFGGGVTSGAPTSGALPAVPSGMPGTSPTTTPAATTPPPP